jgi:hypothetical protein
VGGATNWSLIDKFGNQILLELVVMLILLKRWFLLAGKVRGVLTKLVGLSVASPFRKDVVITAPLNPFFLPRFSVVDKTNLSLPGWTNIVQSGKTF